VLGYVIGIITFTPVTLRTSLRSLYLNLWDETNRRLVSFGEAGALSKPAGAGRA